jgi:hypothetical protein
MNVVIDQPKEEIADENRKFNSFVNPSTGEEEELDGMIESRM